MKYKYLFCLVFLALSISSCKNSEDINPTPTEEELENDEPSDFQSFEMSNVIDCIDLESSLDKNKNVYKVDDFIFNLKKAKMSTNVLVVHDGLIYQLYYLYPKSILTLSNENRGITIYNTFIFENVAALKENRHRQYNERAITSKIQIDDKTTYKLLKNASSVNPEDGIYNAYMYTRKVILLEVDEYQLEDMQRKVKLFNAYISSRPENEIDKEVVNKLYSDIISL